MVSYFWSLFKNHSQNVQKLSYYPLIYKKIKSIDVNAYHQIIKKMINFLINQNVGHFLKYQSKNDYLYSII